jgi:hypothetical protein
MDHHANPDWFTRSRFQFYVEVSKDNTWIASTQEAAYEAIADVADELAEKHKLERRPVRNAGNGAQDYGDLVCDVAERGKDDEASLRFRVHAWRIRFCSVQSQVVVIIGRSLNILASGAILRVADISPLQVATSPSSQNNSCITAAQCRC